jgi:hypothetical protein
MSLQLRRGPLADLATITPLAGEPIWTTDTNKLYVGDGVTPGGIMVSSTATGGPSNPFDQTLNTTSTVAFSRVTLLPDQSTYGRIYGPQGYSSVTNYTNINIGPSGTIYLEALTDVGSSNELTALYLQDGKFEIFTRDGGGINKSWNFDKDGIKFPDNTFQTTAFTGTASNPFNQNLNTTSTVAFANATITNTLYIGTDTTNTIGMIGDTFVIASTYPGGLSLDAGVSELLLAASNGIRLQAPLRSTSSNPITFDPGNGSVEPTFDAAADLGRTSKTWRNIYLVNTGTVFFGTNTVAVSSTGTLLVNGASVQTTAGGTSVYERGGLPMGTPGQIITISDSGTDDNSPAGNWAPAYWDDDATEWVYIGNSNSVTAI